MGASDAEPSGAARFGFPHRHFRLTDSTNARARELAEGGAPGGLVVTADEQEAGHGRHGRSWFARPGTALLYSALLRPLGDRPLLPLAVPLAACEVAESLAAVECAIKWPNDVWVGTRKLAGVLIESRFEPDGSGWAVIGVGLNLTVARDELPRELREIATSLAIESGEAHTTGLSGIGAPREPQSRIVQAVVAKAALDAALGRWVDASPDAILAGFRSRDALAGRRISWDGGAGTATGISDAGHLLVDTGEGERRELGAGEVHLGVER